MKDTTEKSFPIPLPETEGNLMDTDLNSKLQHSYEQSLAGKGRPFEEVFHDLERG